MRPLLAAAIVVGCGRLFPDASVASNAPTMAAANVIVGGALYVAAGGCKIAGCPTNTKCNVSTERCEPVQCNKSSCPADAVCDEQSGRCLPAHLTVVTAGSSATPHTPPVPSAIAGPNGNN